MKQLKATEVDGTTERGVVYVGRIPHGFYEHQMREYFSQFGPVTRLRLSRNRKTGAPKHYAFIEFESDEVAKVAAATMHNYLLFGHILKCKLLAKENVHEDLWKGANKRFKVMPGNKIEGRKLALPASKTEWKARQQKEEKKRAEKLERTKKLGYEFVNPALKSVDDVQKTISGVDEAIETLVEEEKSLVTTQNGDVHGITIVSEELKTKEKKNKKKKKKNQDAKAEETSLVTVGNGDADAISIVSEEVKSSKRKKKCEKAAEEEEKSLVPTRIGRSDRTSIMSEEVTTPQKKKRKDERVGEDEEKSLLTVGNGDADDKSTMNEEGKATTKKKKKENKKVATDEADDVNATAAKSTKRAFEVSSSDVAEKSAKKAKKGAKKSAA